MFTEPQEIRLARHASSRSTATVTARDEAFAAAGETAKVATDLALAAGLREQLASLEAQQRELSRLLAALER